MRFLWLPVSFCVGVVAGLWTRCKERRQRHASEEHLWGEFDGETCCQYCYRKQTSRNRHERCRSNVFYDSPWRWS